MSIPAIIDILGQVNFDLWRLLRGSSTAGHTLKFGTPYLKRATQLMFHPIGVKIALSQEAQIFYDQSSRPATEYRLAPP